MHISHPGWGRPLPRNRRKRYNLSVGRNIISFEHFQKPFFVFLNKVSDLLNVRRGRFFFLKARVSIGEGGGYMNYYLTIISDERGFLGSKLYFYINGPDRSLKKFYVLNCNRKLNTYVHIINIRMLSCKNANLSTERGDSLCPSGCLPSLVQLW